MDLSITLDDGTKLTAIGGGRISVKPMLDVQREFIWDDECQRARAFLVENEEVFEDE